MSASTDGGTNPMSHVHPCGRSRMVGQQPGATFATFNEKVTHSTLHRALAP
jgi:hypothetical protein